MTQNEASSTVVQMKGSAENCARASRESIARTLVF